MSNEGLVTLHGFVTQINGISVDRIEAETLHVPSVTTGCLYPYIIFIPMFQKALTKCWSWMSPDLGKMEKITSAAALCPKKCCKVRQQHQGHQWRSLLWSCCCSLLLPCTLQPTLHTSMVCCWSGEFSPNRRSRYKDTACSGFKRLHTSTYVYV